MFSISFVGMKCVMYRVISVMAIVLMLKQTVWCQQEQNIHIQSENDQVFEVHFNGNTVQSSDGYLIVPTLSAGAYTIVMSFPGTALPAYAFFCTVEDKPLGYSLKLGVDNKWILFNMVDFTELQGAVATREQIFAAIQKPGEAKPIVTEHTAPDVMLPKAIPPGIRKIFDKATPGGKDQVYIVTNGSKTDTIAIFIPDIDPARPAQTGKTMDTPIPGQSGLFIAMNTVLALHTRRNKPL